MKKYSASLVKCFMVGCLSVLLVFSASLAWAQDFSGVRTSDYSGVNGVFFNPAGIAGSPYRFDISLASVSVSVGNNKVALGLDNMVSSLNGDSIKNTIFGGNGMPVSGMVNLDVHGPSFMFNTSAKTAFAVTTRVRCVTNVSDLDGKLFENLKDLDNGQDLPYQISSSRDMRVTSNAWSEFGLSMAHIVMNRGGHLLKVGATVKYLVGTAGTYIELNKLKGTLTASADNPNDESIYLQNASGQVSVGSAGVNLNDVDANQLLKVNGSGIGGDIGLVYEYRSKATSFDSVAFRQFIQTPYKVRVSLSLLDIGSLSYHEHVEAGRYNIDISDNEKLNMEHLGDVSLANYKSYFDSQPEYFTPSKGNAGNTYDMTLPTSLLASVDYRLLRGLYVDIQGRISLSGMSGKPYNGYYSSGVWFTPRYEGRKVGAYMPVSYSKLTGLNAGFALRTGMFFFGSGGILTALWGKSKLVDFNFGIHISGLRRKNR